MTKRKLSASEPVSPQRPAIKYRGHEHPLVERTRYQCEACEAVCDEPDPIALYECGNCGTIFNRDDSADGCSHKCPDCNKFASKLGDVSCPDCGKGPVEDDTGPYCEVCDKWIEDAGVVELPAAQDPREDFREDVTRRLITHMVTTTKGVASSISTIPPGWCVQVISAAEERGIWRLCIEWWGIPDPQLTNKPRAYRLQWYRQYDVTEGGFTFEPISSLASVRATFTREHPWPRKR
jgi:hypothetical protein